jgi:hypothetical protein
MREESKRSELALKGSVVGSKVVPSFEMHAGAGGSGARDACPTVNIALIIQGCPWTFLHQAARRSKFQSGGLGE